MKILRRTAWGVLATIVVLTVAALNGHVRLPTHTWDWVVIVGIVAALVLLPTTSRKAK